MRVDLAARPLSRRAVGLILGYAADRVFGDPRRGHPVALFGSAATALEEITYGDSRARGLAHHAVCVGLSVAVTECARRRSRRHPIADVALTAIVTWAVLGGRSLEREAHAVHQLLSADDLEGARLRLRHLVGRDTSALTADEIARAVVESVAENSSDAVVTSLLWGALFGAPGLVLHRTANTLDAMIGHHNARYENFGWAAARFDDALGYPGSRCAGLLIAGCGGDPVATLRAWRRDARQHPSPNAGVVEAGFAGALGIRLGGTNTYYGNRTEHRALMGSGRHPDPTDIPRVATLARRIGLAATLVAALGCVVGETARR